MKKRGFTIIEVVTVVAIMAIMTTLVYSSFSNTRARSRDQQRVSDISTLQLSLEVYFNKNGQYPPTLASLVPVYIASVPNPPTGAANYAYNYFPISTVSPSYAICTSYHLWTRFELSNQYLLSKKGFDSTSLTECSGGAVGTYINASSSANALVYDVTSQ